MQGQHSTMKIVESSEEGSGLDISPHFRYADKAVDSTLLEDLTVHTTRCTLACASGMLFVAASRSPPPLSVLLVPEYVDSDAGACGARAMQTARQLVRVRRAAHARRHRVLGPARYVRRK